MRFMGQFNPVWAHTGYSGQGFSIMLYAFKDGHQFAHFPNFGFRGGLFQMNIGGYELPVYPVFEDDDGHDVIRAHLSHFRADYLLTLYDLFVSPMDFHQYFPQPWIAMFPIDTDPISRLLTDRFQNVDYPIVYSQFASRLMDEGKHKYTYIPHGIDTATYTPGDRKAAREYLKLPQDAYIVSMVGTNMGHPTRKGIYENLAAFRNLLDRHDDAFLCLHTRVNPLYNMMSNGVFVQDVLSRLGIPRERVRISDQYGYLLGMNPQWLAQLYRASNVLLHNSYGEGFGLVMAEAQACGLQVIAGNWSSMPELMHYGYLTEPAQKYWTTHSTFQWIPSVTNITDTLLHCYNTYDENSDALMGLSAHSFIHDNYAMPYIWDTYWRPFMDLLQYDLDERNAKKERAAEQVEQEVESGDYSQLQKLVEELQDNDLMVISPSGRVVTLPRYQLNDLVVDGHRLSELLS